MCLENRHAEKEGGGESGAVEKSGSDPNSGCVYGWARVQNYPWPRYPTLMADLFAYRSLSCAKRLFRFNTTPRAHILIVLYNSKNITFVGNTLSRSRILSRNLALRERESEWIWAESRANKTVPRPLSRSRSPTYGFYDTQTICNYRCDSGKMIRDYLILLSWLCAVQGKIGKCFIPYSGASLRQRIQKQRCRFKIQLHFLFTHYNCAILKLCIKRKM